MRLESCTSLGALKSQANHRLWQDFLLDDVDDWYLVPPGGQLSNCTVRCELMSIKCLWERQ